MKTEIHKFVAGIILFFTSASAAIGDELPRPQAALLAQFCIDCHDADVQKGKLDLDSVLDSPVAE
ncbi:MAG: hypothetical protein AAF585_25610, partial [Verrucomicrobiota bacterium]